VFSIHVEAGRVADGRDGQSGSNSICHLGVSPCINPSNKFLTNRKNEHGSLLEEFYTKDAYQFFIPIAVTPALLEPLRSMVTMNAVILLASNPKCGTK